MNVWISLGAGILKSMRVADLRRNLLVSSFFFNAQAHKDWQLAGVGVGSILVRSLALQAGRLYCHSVL